MSFGSTQNLCGSLEHATVRQNNLLVTVGQVSDGVLEPIQELHSLAHLAEGDPAAIERGQRLEADGEVHRRAGIAADIATGKGEDAGIHAVVQRLEVVLDVGQPGVPFRAHVDLALQPDGRHGAGKGYGMGTASGADPHELQHHLRTGLGEELDGETALEAALRHLNVQVDLGAQQLAEDAYVALVHQLFVAMEDVQRNLVAEGSGRLGESLRLGGHRVKELAALVELLALLQQPQLLVPGQVGMARPPRSQAFRRLGEGAQRVVALLVESGQHLHVGQLHAVALDLDLRRRQVGVHLALDIAHPLPVLAVQLSLLVDHHMGAGLGQRVLANGHRDQALVVTKVLLQYLLLDIESVLLRGVGHLAIEPHQVGVLAVVDGIGHRVGTAFHGRHVRGHRAGHQGNTRSPRAARCVASDKHGLLKIDILEF